MNATLVSVVAAGVSVMWYAGSAAQQCYAEHSNFRRFRVETTAEIGK